MKIIRDTRGLLVKVEVDYFSEHIHSCISNFRLKDSTIKIPDVISRSIELGYNGCALTDHEALTGHIQFLQRYEQLKSLKEKYNKYIEEEDFEGLKKDKDVQKEIKLLEKMSDDFKIGLGNEIYLVDSLEEVRENYESGVTKFYHFILIAKDAKGYEQIRRISAESAWNNWYKTGRMERVPTIKSELEEIIGEDKGHIIATTACLGGELPTLALSYYRDGNLEAKNKIKEFMHWCIDIFGRDNFYVELQPTIHLPNNDIMEQHPQITFNTNILKVCKAFKVKYTVATDAHYLKKEDREIHKAFLTSDEDNKSAREVDDFYETTYMMSKEEIYECLSTHLTDEEIENAFNGTMDIHSKIESFTLAHDVIVPRDKDIPEFEVMHLFKGWYNKYPVLEKFAYSDDEQDRYYLYLCEKGFLEKNFDIMDETYASRLSEEIDTIDKISDRLGQKLSAYYVLVRGLIHNILWRVSFVGVSRGSVTGWFGAYLMGITQMNPLKYNLPWWRHLHPSRPELPDIDTDSEASKRQLIFSLMKEKYGVDNVLNTLTVKTEGSKSSIITGCRGLGIDTDVAQYLSGFVPIERGQAWSLSDCFFGNKSKDRKPIKEFVNEVEKYDRLKETVLGLEGLITGRSIHASAVYVFDNGYLAQNGRMKAPNGSDITCYDMHDSDYCGGLKIDELTVSALDKIHKAMDLLQEQGFIEDKGSIKATYDYYLHPDVLEYEDAYMWKLLGENKINDAFQMDTPQGKIACKMVKPTTLEQLAVANSVMRLMSNGTEQPIDTYVRYKNDISLWYEECRNYGLSEEEIKILEPYLLPVSGVSVTQEDIMLLSMEERISNFTVAESNGLRKAIAKKKADLVEKTRLLFYEKGSQQGASQTLLDYVWNVQIGRLLGYAFSLNHTSPYSCICLQEMNIATRFSPIFWNTACLSVNANADDNEEIEASSKSKTTNYGKIAKAIGNIQSEGQAVALPDINRARFGFYPDVDNEEIVFSLKGISGVSDDVASVILELRPFTSLKDFVTRMEEAKVEQGFKFSSSSVIALIKAGAFDKIENKDRMDIMIDYVKSISKPLGSLSFFSHMQTLKDLDLLTEEQIGREFRYFKYRNYVMRDKFFVRQDGKSPTTKVYYLDREKAEPYFLDNFAMDLKEGKDYWYNDQGFIEIKKGTFERIITKAVAPFVASVLNNPETLAKVNEERFYVKWEELGLGNNISKWEMDSLCFYYHDHELAHVKAENYLISEYKSLPETPVVAEFYKFRGKERPRFALTKICGTVLDKDKNKNTITLLTHDKEVVTIKFYKGQFGFYDKQISEIDSEGNKTVMEKSWFGRGNKLLITGYRSEDRFIPKKYNDSIFKHTVQLINYIDEEGNLFLQTDRYGYESDEYC